MTQPVHPQHFQQLAAHTRRLSEAYEALKRDSEQMKLHLRDLGTVQKVLENVKLSGFGGADRGPQNAPMVKRADGAVVPIWDIPGKQIPYDFLVDIPIRDGVTNAVSNTLYVTMEGPFVATARVAIVRSAFSFQFTPPQERGATAARFQGRSFGRYRPVHSAADVNDAMGVWAQPSMYQTPYLGAVIDSAGPTVIPVANPMGVQGLSGADGTGASPDLTNMIPNFPGNGRPLNVSPVSMASSRSMQLDATITVDVQGANFKRSNIGVPSAFWTTLYNSPWDLAAFDVFDPGETISIDVTPTHPNNPAYGNISGLMLRSDVFNFTATGAAMGASTSDPSPAGSSDGGFPFIAGQFDAHEGINDESISGDTTDTTDRVARVADSYLTIGFKGYKIIQSPQTLARLGGTACPSEHPCRDSLGLRGATRQTQGPRRRSATPRALGPTASPPHSRVARPSSSPAAGLPRRTLTSRSLRGSRSSRPSDRYSIGCSIRSSRRPGSASSGRSRTRPSTRRTDRRGTPTSRRWGSSRSRRVRRSTYRR